MLFKTITQIIDQHYDYLSELLKLKENLYFLHKITFCFLNRGILMHLGIL